MKIALGQMDIAFGDPDANLKHVADLAAKASAQQAQLLVLPELWSTGYDLENASKYATDVSSGIFADTAAIAAEFNLHIVGSCLSAGSAGPRNTITWATPEGEIIADYSKLHLFRLMDEDQYLSAGDAPVLVETDMGNAGLSICYDLRFAELFRGYALDGAQFVIVPAEWPNPRKMHWRTLLRARAIENQMFVIACNRVGEENGTTFFGHSAVIDPWGEYLVEAGEDPGLYFAEIDVAEVDRVRDRIKVFEDRRPDVYRL